MASLVFTSSKKGYAAYTDGHIINAVDSGKTWNYPASGILYTGGIKTLQFFNEQVGYFTSGNFGPSSYGSTYQTIDSGATWQLRKDISGNSIVFLPDFSVIIAGYGGVLLSEKNRDAITDSPGGVAMYLASTPM